MLSLIGFLAPRIYWEHFDKREYYSIALPVATDKAEYVSGEAMYLSMEKTALISTSASSTNKLILLRGDGDEVVVGYDQLPDSLVEGSEKISIRILIPEDLETGAYMWRGVVTYRVKGLDKSFFWYSQRFFVSQSEI